MKTSSDTIGNRTRDLPACITVVYYISAVNTQDMQRPDVLVELGYIWQHVSAVSRPSSGQEGIILY